MSEENPKPPRKPDPEQAMKDAVEAAVLESREPGVRYRTPFRTTQSTRKPLPPGMKWKGGGWKGNPNSIAALEAHREKTMFGKTPVEALRCKGTNLAGHRCKGVVVRGMDYCHHHGGMTEILARRKLDPGYRVKRITATHRAIKTLLRSNSIPFELMQQPIFQAVLTRAVGARGDRRNMTGEEVSAARSAWREANRLCMELMQAWTVFKDVGDLRPWSAAVTKASNAGF